jgi:hypothetical protein
MLMFHRQCVSRALLSHCDSQWGNFPMPISYITLVPAGTDLSQANWRSGDFNRIGARRMEKWRIELKVE